MAKTFLIGPNLGDTVDNGLLFDLAEYQRQKSKGPISRAGKIKDGAGTTLLLAENIHKTYSHPTGGGGAVVRLGWVARGLSFKYILAMSNSSEWFGLSTSHRSCLRCKSKSMAMPDDLADFDPSLTSICASGRPHGDGVNVVFADGHGQFMPSNIDYTSTSG